MDHFKLVSDFQPSGDQPEAIADLVAGLNDDLPAQVLLGVTGSGKTFTIANVVAQVNRPTLVLAHNKILAAQLYGEFKSLFPENAVEYFVSYYDYYQPEAYVPSSDTYIEKDASINDEIDKMRHSATKALLSRRDCLIVASVSCIYGIGSPDSYSALRVELSPGEEYPRDQLLDGLIAMQYARHDTDFYRGTFRVRGDVVDIFPAYEADRAIRVEYFGDEIEQISEIDPLRGNVLRKMRRAEIYPGSHYATSKETLKSAATAIQHELEERLKVLRSTNDELYAQLLGQRTRYDLEMIQVLDDQHVAVASTQVQPTDHSAAGPSTLDQACCEVRPDDRPRYQAASELRKHQYAFRGSEPDAALGLGDPQVEHTHLRQVAPERPVDASRLLELRELIHGDASLAERAQPLLQRELVFGELEIHGGVGS